MPCTILQLENAMAMVIQIALASFREACFGGHVWQMLGEMLSFNE